MSYRRVTVYRGYVIERDTVSTNYYAAGIGGAVSLPIMKKQIDWEIYDRQVGAAADALDTARARTAWYVEAEELATDVRDCGEPAFIEVRAFDTASGRPEIITLPREWFD